MRLLLNSLAPYLKRYKWLLVSGFVVIIISNLFAILPANFVRRAFDYTEQSLDDGVSKDEIFTQLLIFAALILGAALLRGFFMVLMRQTIIVMSRKIEYDQKNDLFAKYQTYSQTILRKRQTGDLMARIAEDIGHVRMFTGPGIMYTFNTATLFVVVLPMMLSVSPLLTLYVVLPFPVLALTIYIVQFYILKRSEAVQAQLSSMNSFTQESYSGIRLLRAYARENSFKALFDKQSGEYRRLSLRLARVDAFFFPAILLLIGLSTVFAVWIGGREVITGDVSVGNIAEFIIYIGMFTWPVASLGWVTSLIQRAVASQKRINEYLALESELDFPAKSEPITEGSFELKNVKLTYADTGIESLKDISLNVPAGSMLGVVGPTGSGKSSLTNLMVRFMDPDEGEVRVDGRPIQSYSKAALRSAIGYVPQDGFLFSDSIANNIAFGKIDASREEVEAAAKFAGVYEDILDFPKGFDTRVGERGVTLSGGQKQRISIARAYLSQPRMLIMDDSLSAIDTETEERILKNLREELKSGGQPPTLIVVAHRLSSVRDADQIVVLEAGKISERGTHAELIQNGGFYAAVFEQQQLQRQEEN
ncbi:MAG: ABC transporter ATP-binding protein [Bacteroidota bacterium]